MVAAPSPLTGTSRIMQKRQKRIQAITNGNGAPPAVLMRVPDQTIHASVCRIATQFRACTFLFAALSFLVLAVAAAGGTGGGISDTQLLNYNYKLSVARHHLASTSVANLAFFAGGEGTAGFSNVVDVFNTISGKWTNASLTVSRSQLAATSVGSLALFAGGLLQDSTTTSVVDIFDMASGVWSTASLSVARYILAATSVADLALFGGGAMFFGQDQGKGLSSVVDIFNVTSGLWTVQSLRVARSYLVATSVANLALFGGGVSDDGIPTKSQVVDIFNVTSGLWTTASLSVARMLLSATSVADLALFGGGLSDRLLTVVDIFNVTSGLWTVQSLRVARCALAATSFSNLALFGGGQTWSPTDIVEIFNVTSRLWTTVRLSGPRSRLAATSVSNMAIFGPGEESQYRVIVDIFLSGCLSGMFINASNITGGCETCPPGFFCPPASSLPPFQCKPGCFCPSGSGESTPCPAGTHNPEPGAVEASECRPCRAGSYNPGSQPAIDCTLCQAGTFNSFPKSTSPTSCTPCDVGTYNPARGANSSTACLPCGAGLYGDTPALSFCKLCSLGTSKRSASRDMCVPCAAGTFSNVEGLSVCTPCDSGTFNPSNGSKSAAACIPCPKGHRCPAGSGTPCVCNLFEYQPSAGASACLSCPLALDPTFGADACKSQASPESFLTSAYLTLAVIFCCICLTAVVLFARLVRLRHTFSLRAVHVGTCIYVAMFVPYAALQVLTLVQLGYLNDRGADSIARASVQISSGAVFAVFFALGFTGKVALVQMWTHVVRRHTNGSSDVTPRLRGALNSTYKAFLWTVVCVVVLYVIGFSVLTNRFIAALAQCADGREIFCLISSQAQPCHEMRFWKSVIDYYEGIWAGIVLLIFTTLAFLFNGVVFAM
jgi:hypothetical protein